jgi:hypothetical protein
MIGSATFSTVMKGFSFFTLLPVFFIPLAFKTKKDFDEVNKEIESRK